MKIFSIKKLSTILHHSVTFLSLNFYALATTQFSQKLTNFVGRNAHPRTILTGVLINLQMTKFTEQFQSLIKLSFQFRFEILGKFHCVFAD
jgi:hypothetical protein